MIEKLSIKNEVSDDKLVYIYPSDKALIAKINELVEEVNRLSGEGKKDEKWEPEISERYYYIDDSGEVEYGLWDAFSIDQGRRDFLGVYRTKEEAQARLEEIKRLLGNK